MAEIPGAIQEAFRLVQTVFFVWLDLAHEAPEDYWPLLNHPVYGFWRPVWSRAEAEVITQLWFKGWVGVGPCRWLFILPGARDSWDDIPRSDRMSIASYHLRALRRRQLSADQWELMRQWTDPIRTCLEDLDAQIHGWQTLDLLAAQATRMLGRRVGLPPGLRPTFLEFSIAVIFPNGDAIENLTEAEVSAYREGTLDLNARGDVVPVAASAYRDRSRSPRRIRVTATLADLDGLSATDGDGSPADDIQPAPLAASPRRIRQTATLADLDGLSATDGDGSPADEPAPLMAASHIQMESVNADEVHTPPLSIEIDQLDDWNGIFTSTDWF